MRISETVRAKGDVWNIKIKILPLLGLEPYQIVCHLKMAVGKALLKHGQILSPNIVRDPVDVSISMKYYTDKPLTE
jgi:hypothetical protein